MDTKEITLFELSRKTEKVSVSDVYKALMTRAKRMREIESDGYQDRADELYAVAAALENTEEINPVKAA